MLFNSLEFVLFFAIVYTLYRVLPHRPQNVLLLVSSYIFYGWWDWRFCSLIAISTVVDYCCGLAIDRSNTQRSRRAWLSLSLVSNLGILGFFKYADFSASSLSRAVGFQLDPVFSEIILPVGISFYTFQTLSYTIDVYRQEMKATRNFLDFAVFVSFFPQLVAGPIERARVLLPQVSGNRRVSEEDLRAGLHLVVTGFMFKLIVAEKMAPITKDFFTHPENYRGLNIVVGCWAAARPIAPTNNASERSLTSAVIKRKLSFGTQSDAGSRFVETLLTVIETCRRQGRSALAYVTEAVSTSQPESLLHGV